MKTIVVPIDFSEISTNALAYAKALAGKFASKIILLHAYYSYPLESSINLSGHSEGKETQKKELEADLKKLCHEVQESASCKCACMVEEGLASDVIIHQAKKLNPDLLIMGTERLSPVDKMLFGTITGKVIKKAPCAVLVVPEDTPYKPPQRMAFATNYSYSDMEEIKFMIDISQKFKSDLHIIHVVTRDEKEEFEKQFFSDFQKELRHAFPGQKLTLRLLKGKSLVKEIEKYVAVEHIDILAVGRSRKNSMERLLAGSTTQKLFSDVHTPLLVFQTEDFPVQVLDDLL